MTRLAAIIVLLAALVPHAAACPLCDSETAEETRAGLFNDEFFSNLFTGLLPFIIVTGIALAVHIDWTRVRGSTRHRLAPSASSRGQPS